MIYENVYTEMLLSSLPRFIRLSSESLILIGCRGNIKFRKIYIVRMKLKLGIHASDITLYKSDVF